MLNLFKEHGDVQLPICLFSGLVDFDAVCPLRVATTKSLDPVINSILDIKPEVEIFLADSLSIVAVVKSSFCYHQLIPVFIERHHEES